MPFPVLMYLFAIYYFAIYCRYLIQSTKVQTLTEFVIKKRSKIGVK